MKYYAVKKGRTKGVFYTWEDCKKQVDKFPKAEFKSFSTLEEANNFVIGEKISPAPKLRTKWNDNSLNCDGGYSSSTKVMDFRILDTYHGDVILYRKYPWGTNNIAEFLALVFAMMYIKENSKHDKVIYSDSVTAITWVKNKAVNTLFNTSDIPDIKKCLDFLSNENLSDYKVEKWKTKEWGQIPSDFNRK